MDVGPYPLVSLRECVSDTKIRLTDGSSTAVDAGNLLLNMDPAPASSEINGNSVCNGPVSHEVFKSAREQPAIQSPEVFVRIVDNLRGRVQKGRRELVTQRCELRQLREDMEVLEDGLICALERLMNRTDAQLSEQFAGVKAMRREIKTREHAYDVAEDRLYSDEFELKAKEEKLYPNIALDSGTQLEPASSPPPEKIYANGHPLPKDVNPLYNYERTVGLANLLHEEIIELIHDRQDMLEEQQQRHYSGEELDQASVEFLNNYETTFTRMVNELDMLEDKIAKLQKDAIEDELLHPADAYFRTRPWAALPSEQAAIQPSGNRSINSEMEAPDRLSDSDKILLEPRSRFQLPFALLPTIDVGQWLNDQITEDDRRPPTPDEILPEPLDKNWVTIIKAKARSVTELSKLQNMAPQSGLRPLKRWPSY